MSGSHPFRYFAGKDGIRYSVPSISGLLPAKLSLAWWNEKQRSAWRSSCAAPCVCAQVSPIPDPRFRLRIPTPTRENRVGGPGCSPSAWTNSRRACGAESHCNATCLRLRWTF